MCLQHDKAAVDAHGWLSTGDIATINEEGYLHITDRIKDVIKSGGEWISPSVIERVILSHDKVSCSTDSVTLTGYEVVLGRRVSMSFHALKHTQCGHSCSC